MVPRYITAAVRMNGVENGHTEILDVTIDGGEGDPLIVARFFDRDEATKFCRAANMLPDLLDLVRVGVNLFEPQMERSPAFRECLEAFGLWANFKAWMNEGRATLGFPKPAAPRPAGDDLDHGQLKLDPALEENLDIANRVSPPVELSAADRAKAGGPLSDAEYAEYIDPGPKPTSPNAEAAAERQDAGGGR